jgi:hypothetical protein
MCSASLKFGFTVETPRGASCLFPNNEETFRHWTTGIQHCVSLYQNSKRGDRSSTTTASLIASLPPLKTQRVGPQVSQ